ncbi:MAG: hypothetical protein N3A38_03710 [Planctomycetota bacterium]|nr:hypothetical protein [Planctomycetota bacterium]
MGEGGSRGISAKDHPEKTGTGEHRRKDNSSPLFAQPSPRRGEGLPRRRTGSLCGNAAARPPIVLDESWKDYIRAAVAVARLSKVCEE